VRKEHSPLIAYPLVEVDVALGGFSLEVRELIADIHDYNFCSAADRSRGLSSTEKFVIVRGGEEVSEKSKEPRNAQRATE
jgi:hypothetical protein